MPPLFTLRKEERRKMWSGRQDREMKYILRREKKERSYFTHLFFFHPWPFFSLSPLVGFTFSTIMGIIVFLLVPLLFCISWVSCFPRRGLLQLLWNPVFWWVGPMPSHHWCLDNTQKILPWILLILASLWRMFFWTAQSFLLWSHQSFGASLITLVFSHDGDIP